MLREAMHKGGIEFEDLISFSYSDMQSKGKMSTKFRENIASHIGVVRHKKYQL